MGSPWRIPLVGLIISTNSLLIQTLYGTIEIQSIMCFIQDSSKPSCIILNFRNCQSTLSKALTISNFKASNPYFPLVLCFNKWQSSQTRMMLSVISLLEKNVDQILELTKWSIPLRRFVMTFEIHRYRTLHKESGLNSVTRARLLCFRIKTMVVEFNLSRMVQEQR